MILAITLIICGIAISISSYHIYKICMRFWSVSLALAMNFSGCASFVLGVILLIMPLIKN